MSEHEPLNLSPSQRYVIDTITEKLDTLFTHSSLLEYYQGAVIELGTAVGADHTFIGAISDRNPLQVETLAYCKGRTLQENFSYTLSDTPCEQVLNRGVCLYPNHVHEQFPKDQLLRDMMISGYVGEPLMHGDRITGILTALFLTPVREPAFVTKAFQAVADCINRARAARVSGIKP